MGVKIRHHPFDRTGVGHGVGIEEIDIVRLHGAADRVVDAAIIAIAESAVAVGFDQFHLVDAIHRPPQDRQRIVWRLIVDDIPDAPGPADLLGSRGHFGGQHAGAAIIYRNHRKSHQAAPVESASR